MLHSFSFSGSTRIFIPLLALALFVVNPDQLRAADKHDAYDVSIKVGRVDGKRVEFEFTLTTSDPKYYPLPKSVDQLQLKFFGVDGGVVYIEKLTDFLLGKPQKNTVSWIIKVKAYEPYGSVDAKLLFGSRDGTVQLGAEAYISGYRLLSSSETYKDGLVQLTVTLTSSDIKRYALPKSLDKVQAKIFDNLGDVVTVENFTDVYLKLDKKRMTASAVLRLDALFKGNGTYEIDAHIKPVQRTLILSDAGDICYKKCLEEIEIKLPPIEEKLKKSTAGASALEQLPAQYALSAYPNPFNPATTVRLEVLEPQLVNLVIYDILGQRIDELISNEWVSGSRTVRWDGHDFKGRQVPTGVYILRMQTENYVKAMRLLLLK